ncbi:MAG: tape measure protein [Gammaproteobacteria bacterium]|nr:tape measure protein [Gammaproteobacteria bacterium]
MTTKKLSFDIEANSDSAKRALAELRSAFDATLAALKKQQGEVALFKAAQRDAAALEKQIKALGRAGGDTTALNTALSAQRATLAQLSASLQKAGIDTNALTAAQARLRGQVEQVKRNFVSQSQTVRDELGGIEKKSAGVGNVLSGVFSKIGFQLGAVLSVGKIATMSDEYASLQARLKLASRSTEEFAAANDDVVRIASAARVPLAQTAELYVRIASSVKDLDVAQRDVAGVTEAVGLALKLSGASAAESGSAMLQFSQAIASGVLRGEEFNSVNEAAPRLLQGLAKSLGVPVGQLREMAKAGQLTRDVLIDGLLKDLPTLRTEAASLPDTIGGTFTDLGNKLRIVVGQFDQATGASKGFAGVINAVGTTGIEALAVVGANVAFVFKGIGREIGGIAAQLVALATFDFKGFKFIGEQMKKDAAEARRELDAFEKRILEGAGRVVQATEKTTRAMSDRNVAQKALAARLAETVEGETKRVEAALEAQVAAQRKAQSEAGKINSERVELAKRNAARLADIQAPKAKSADLNANDPTERFFNQAAARASLQSLQAQQQAALASNDFDKAIDLGERASSLIAELNSAGASAASVLASQQREVAALQDEALAGKAEAAKAKAAEAVAAVDALKKELESLKAVPVQVDLKKAEESVREAQKRMQAILDGKPLTQSVSLSAGGADLPAKADGGLLRGPGTGTSDSILARVSNGEYVVRARAVRQLGLANMHAINQGRLPDLRAAAMRLMDGRQLAIRSAIDRRIPRFADGGLIAGSVGSLPRPSADGGGATSILNLTLPGVGTFETRADAAVADSLERALRTAALKHGRRT